MVNLILLTVAFIALVGVLGPPVLIAAGVGSAVLLLICCVAIIATIAFIVIRMLLSVAALCVYSWWKEMYGESKEHKQNIAEQ